MTERLARLMTMESASLQQHGLLAPVILGSDLIEEVVPQSWERTNVIFYAPLPFCRHHSVDSLVIAARPADVTGNHGQANLNGRPLKS